LARIKADYEVGVTSKSIIASKHRINRTTLLRVAKREGWKYQKCIKNASKSITQNATKKIVELETNKLIDCTLRHLRETGNLRVLSDLAVKRISKAAKDTKNNISKMEADTVLTIQRFIETNAKTLSIIYKDERLAMGLDNGIKSDDGDVEDRINKRMNKLKNAD